MKGTIAWVDKITNLEKKAETTILCPYRVFLPNGGSSLFGFIIDGKEQLVMVEQHAEEDTWKAMKLVKGIPTPDQDSLTPYLNLLHRWKKWAWE